MWTEIVKGISIWAHRREIILNPVTSPKTQEWWITISASHSVYLIQIHSQVLHQAFFQRLIVLSIHIVFHMTPRHPWKAFSKCILSLWMISKVYGKKYRHSLWYSWSLEWALCHLLHLSRHFCSPLNEECCCCISREHWSNFLLTLKSIKCKWNNVVRLQKV